MPSAVTYSLVASVRVYVAMPPAAKVVGETFFCIARSSTYTVCWVLLDTGTVGPGWPGTGPVYWPSPTTRLVSVCSVDVSRVEPPVLLSRLAVCGGWVATVPPPSTSGAPAPCQSVVLARCGMPAR